MYRSYNNMISQNKKTKTAVTIVTALAIGLIMLSPMTVLPSAHAVSTTHIKKFVPLKPMSKTLAKKLVSPLVAADEVEIYAFDNNGNEYESIYEPDASSSTGYEWYGIFFPSSGSEQVAQADVAYPCDSVSNPQNLEIYYLGSGQWEMAFTDQSGVTTYTTVNSGGTSVNTNDAGIFDGSDISIDSTTLNTSEFVVTYHHISPTCPAIPAKR